MRRSRGSMSSRQGQGMLCKKACSIFCMLTSVTCMFTCKHVEKTHVNIHPLFLMTHNWRSYWVYEAVLLLFLLFRLLTHYWNLETVLGVLRTPSSPVLSHGWMCSGDTSVRTEVLGVQRSRGGSLILLPGTVVRCYPRTGLLSRIIFFF